MVPAADRRDHPAMLEADPRSLYIAGVRTRREARVSVEFARAAEVEIVLHPIPTPDAKPYIIVVGPDGALWFCESGAAKIGRLDPHSGTFTEFATPTPDSRPIGIIPGADGNLWFCENGANQIGRITPQGAITEFALPTPGAGPDGIMSGPDGNIWFSEAHVSRIGRITPG